MRAAVLCSVTWCPYSGGAARRSPGYRAMQPVARYVSAGSGYTEGNLGKLYITWCSSTLNSIRALRTATCALPKPFSHRRVDANQTESTSKEPANHYCWAPKSSQRQCTSILAHIQGHFHLSVMQLKKDFCIRCSTEWFCNDVFFCFFGDAGEAPGYVCRILSEQAQVGTYRLRVYRDVLWGESHNFLSPQPTATYFSFCSKRRRCSKDTPYFNFINQSSMSHFRRKRQEWK